MNAKKTDEKTIVEIIWSRAARRALIAANAQSAATPMIFVGDETSEKPANSESSADANFANAQNEIVESEGANFAGAPPENANIMHSKIDNATQEKAPILHAGNGDFVETQNENSQFADAKNQKTSAANFGLRTLNATTRRAVRAAVASVFADDESESSTLNVRREVVVSFVSDDEIHEMNANYRHKNKPTDVLSFSQDEGEPFPTDADFSSDDDAEDSQNVAPQMLGDVVISIETAWRQAEERAHSLPHEIGFLCVHGTLHLLGFDHIVARDRQKMWKQQDLVTEKLAIS